MDRIRFTGKDSVSQAGERGGPSLGEADGEGFGAAELMLRWSKSRWKNAQAAWSARLRQRMTRAGLAFTLAMLLVAIAAFLSANNLLFLILAAMLSTFLVSGFIGGLGLAGLELDLSLPAHASAGRDIYARVQIRNVKRWLPSFSIHLSMLHVAGPPEPVAYFPVIPGAGQVEQSIQMRFEQRGAYEERSFEVSTRFPFGFTERRETVTIRHEVLVYPCLDPQPGFAQLLSTVRGEIGTTSRGRGTELYRIRPYEAMESSRHVDWKATAHTGQLQVREFAEEQDRSVLIYLDLHVPASLGTGGPWFENAVDCCAYLAFELGERRVRFRFQTQDFDRTSPDESDVYEILRYLALVASRPYGRPDVPNEHSSVHVVMTANPEQLSELGWCVGPGRIADHMLTPANWPK
ncbi:MAG: DUF58 domain-containing protein [Acidobacteriota bacterium]